MLNKRIDIGSIPFGLADAGEDLIKGQLAVIRSDGKAYRPTTQAEADAVKGFAFLVQETREGSDLDHEVLPAGKKVILYTLVQNNRWGTTEFVGNPAVGDLLTVGFTGDSAGKLVAHTPDPEKPVRNVFRVARAPYKAGPFTMIDVDVVSC